MAQGLGRGLVAVRRLLGNKLLLVGGKKSELSIVRLVINPVIQVMNLGLEMEEITRDLPIPVYYQVALNLRKRIQRREWRNGDQIPPESELAKEYGVSRVTLRQALAELVKDGLLTRQRGRGTFVKQAPQPLVHDFSLPFQFAGQLRQLGYTLSHRVLEGKVLNPPPPEVVNNLRLSPGQPVAFLKRLLCINEQPAGLNCSWFSEELCPGIATTPLLDNSLSGTLAQRYNLVPARSKNWMEVSRATEVEAQLLEAYRDTPLFLLKTISFLSDDTPLEYSTTAWLGDSIRFHFNVEFQAEGATVKRV